jgi:hypothetical protein
MHYTHKQFETIGGCIFRLMWFEKMYVINNSVWCFMEKGECMFWYITKHQTDQVPHLVTLKDERKKL